MQSRRPYPSDVSDEDWALVAPCLTLVPEAAGQLEHSLREVFNGLRYVVRHGVAWRAMPHDSPPWHAVYDQDGMQRHASDIALPHPWRRRDLGPARQAAHRA